MIFYKQWDDVRRRVSPPQLQSMGWISEELGIHMVTHYNWRKAWGLQGELVAAYEQDPKAGVLPANSRWWRPRA
jgi:hypothetical protein